MRDDVGLNENGSRENVRPTYLDYPLEQVFSKCVPLTSSVRPHSKFAESKTLGMNPGILF